MYFTLCNGFHALGIPIYKTQMHITIYNINKCCQNLVLNH